MGLYELLNSLYGNYDYADFYNDKENIDQALNYYNFCGLLRQELQEYLSLATNPYLKDRRNYMNILLSKTNFIKLYKDKKIRFLILYYFSNMYFEGLELYLSSIDKFTEAIAYYLLNENYTIETPLNWKKELATYNEEIRMLNSNESFKKNIDTRELTSHDLINKEKYEKINDVILRSRDDTLNNTINYQWFIEGNDLNDEGLFNDFRWIYAESLAYRYMHCCKYNCKIDYKNIEERNLQQINPDRWVAKYDGDGFGFDHLFMDIQGKYPETAIEVKQSTNGFYKLTPLEMFTMRRTPFYYIFLYAFFGKKFNYSYKCKILGFDKNYNELYDLFDCNSRYQFKEDGIIKPKGEEPKKIIFTI